MSESDELSISELRRRREASGGVAPAARAQPGPGRVIDVSEPVGRTAPATGSLPAAAERGRLRRILNKHWRWPVATAVVLGCTGLIVGYQAGRYTASVTLVQRDTTPAFAAGTGGEAFKPRQFSAGTMIQLMASPELARLVAAEASPPIPESALAGSVSLATSPQTELVTLTMAGRDPGELVRWLNLYAQKAIALTREVQREELSRMTGFFSLKLRETDGELETTRRELGSFQQGEQSADPATETQALLRQLGEVLARYDSNRLELDFLEVRANDAQRGESAGQAVLLERIKKAREQVSILLLDKTEAHPEVIKAQAQVTELERQLTNSAGTINAKSANLELIGINARKTSLANEVKRLGEQKDSLQRRISGLSQTGLQYQITKSRQDSLLASRQFLASRQREAQLFEENAVGYYRVLTEATPADVSSRGRFLMAGFGLMAGLALGLVLGGSAAFVVEAQDDRIHTAAEMERLTGLPVLATLGDLATMNAEEKDRWAFRTWTIINGKLDRAPDRGLVCGFVSATAGEGKSTWIDLLASAATRRGLRVVKIIAQPPGDESPGATPAGAAAGAAGSGETTREPAGTVIANALARPADLAGQLDLARATSVELALPNWVWNVERRRQWQSALARWAAVDNVVILVELPAASLPEAVLLAENVPQVIWLARRGRARAGETRLHLETLKHARCQIVGAVLNEAPFGLQNL